MVPLVFLLLLYEVLVFGSGTLAVPLEIGVDELEGKDTQDCVKGHHSCRTLQYAVTSIPVLGVDTDTDGINYLLRSPNVSINTIIRFDNNPSVSIIGNGTSATTIQCTCPQPGHCGLQFNTSTDIGLQGFNVQGCSIAVNLTGNGHHVTMLTGVHFTECEDISITGVTVEESIGYGMSIVNCRGNITINGSTFMSNSVTGIDNVIGGGGLLICDQNTAARNHGKADHSIYPKGRYQITGSNFTDNTVTMALGSNTWYTLAYGGGINVFIFDKVSGRTIDISECFFTNNKAYGGGGLSVTISKGSSLNNVTIERCIFTGNNGSQDRSGGGGGLLVTIAAWDIKNQFELDSDHNNEPKGNMNITECTFAENKARFGGGTAIMASESLKIKVIVFFIDCHWISNTASASAAIDLGPNYDSQDRHDFIAHMHLINCNISNNTIVKYSEKEAKFKGEGVVLITRVKAIMSATVALQGNRDTALYIDSTYLEIDNNSIILFESNHGSNGGAIKLEGFSSIHYGNNVNISFINNNAAFLGGAIFSENSNQHLSYSSHTCLFKPIGTTNGPVNATFLFEDNTSGTHYGQSIYLTSIYACKKFCHAINTSSHSENPLGNTCFGTFIFKFHYLHKSYPAWQINTDVNKFFVDYTNKHQYFVHSKVLGVIPGFTTYIALRTIDDFGHCITVISTFYVNLIQDQSDSGIRIDTGSRVINNNHITMHGHPGLQGNLSINPQTKSEYTPTLILQIELLACPPGYVYINDTCMCSTTHGIIYEGMSGCDRYSGLLLPGYWAGYIVKSGENASEHTLYIGDCPRSYCAPFTDKNSNSERLLKLSRHASKKDLEQLMCATNRKGIMCGECKRNHSVFYHSDSYHCHRNKYCQYGILFFILVDLIPTGVLFAVLLILDVSLTSGSAYSIIFMVQQLHILEVTVRGSILFKQSFSLFEIANAVYSVFDLEFLNIEPLSFCLWSGATTLDVLIIKYASVVFAMILVFLFILMMNYCSRDFIKRIFRRSRLGASHYSIAQGLTAFLVICYTQTTKITFSILNKGIVYGKSYKNHYTLVFLDGGTEYMRGRHLFYAIPAILFLVFIVIPPPLLLLFDPVLSKLEDRLQCHFQPWTRVKLNLKPILDSFQNCFKDHLRWFAGLYFLYRSIILVMLICSRNTLQYYYLVEGMLIIFLTVHSILQPFVKLKHNIIGSLCLCNLVLINYLTIHIYSLVTTQGYITKTRVYQWIQLLLIFMPILFGVVWILKYLTVWCLVNVFKSKRSLQLNFEDSAVSSTNTIDVLFNRSVDSYGSLHDDETERDSASTIINSSRKHSSHFD